eukprot:8079949-Alexandrium_andersonii.AAC.1
MKPEPRSDSSCCIQNRRPADRGRALSTSKHAGDRRERTTAGAKAERRRKGRSAGVHVSRERSESE